MDFMHRLSPAELYGKTLRRDATLQTSSIESFRRVCATGLSQGLDVMSKKLAGPLPSPTDLLANTISCSSYLLFCRIVQANQLYIVAGDFDMGDRVF